MYNMTKQEFLQNTVDYYSKDPLNRRCVLNNCCYYDPVKAEKPKSNGCAIGRYLKKVNRAKFQNQMDDLSHSGIYNVYKTPDALKLLPKWMRDMEINFLQVVQNLHDDGSYWTDTGLSQEGIIEDRKSVV